MAALAMPLAIGSMTATAHEGHDHKAADAPACCAGKDCCKDKKCCTDGKCCHDKDATIAAKCCVGEDCPVAAAKYCACGGCQEGCNCCGADQCTCEGCKCPGCTGKGDGHVALINTKAMRSAKCCTSGQCAATMVSSCQCGSCDDGCDCCTSDKCTCDGCTCKGCKSQSKLLAAATDLISTTADHAKTCSCAKCTTHTSAHDVAMKVSCGCGSCDEGCNCCSGEQCGCENCTCEGCKGTNDRHTVLISASAKTCCAAGAKCCSDSEGKCGEGCQCAKCVAKQTVK